MNTKETIICRDCGREVPREQAFHYRDEYVCPDCAGNNYFFCIGCHSLAELDDMVAINPDTNNEVFVCSNCANSYRICTHCHRHFDDGYFWMSDGSRSVCNHCSDNYYVCDDCGAIVPEDEVYQVGEDYYCENCYSNHRYEEYIHEYSYKPYPDFYGMDEDNMYLGVELEVDRGSDKFELARKLCDDFEEIYLKSDGSLSSYGFEIITMPCTLNYHMNELGWKDIVNLCREYEYLSHNTSTCGLHIHVSRAALGRDETEQDLTIAKLILLIDKWWEGYIIPFSRRGLPELRQWADKPNLEYQSSDDENEMVKKVKSYKTQQSRYKAINLQNEHTIEFRLFRGTLNIRTLKASLQFVAELTRFAKALKLEDLSEATWSDVFSNTEYQELKEYLELKNLI